MLSSILYLWSFRFFMFMPLIVAYVSGYLSLVLSWCIFSLLHRLILCQVNLIISQGCLFCYLFVRSCPWALLLLILLFFLVLQILLLVLEDFVWCQSNSFYPSRLDWLSFYPFSMSHLFQLGSIFSILSMLSKLSASVLACSGYSISFLCLCIYHSFSILDCSLDLYDLKWSYLSAAMYPLSRLLFHSLLNLCLWGC